MRKIVLGILATLGITVGTAFAAGLTFTPKFHIISSVTKPSLARGEVRVSGTYLYVNVSTAQSPKWHRVQILGW